MASMAPSSCASGRCSTGTVGAHCVNTCTRCPRKVWRFSLGLTLTSSATKFIAAVRGEYMSSMMSYPLRTYSCGSSCHSCASSSLKHSSGNTTLYTSTGRCGFICLYASFFCTAVVTYCSRRLVTRSGRYCPCASEPRRPMYASMKRGAYCFVKRCASGRRSFFSILGSPYRLYILFTTCSAHFLHFHQLHCRRCSGSVGWPSAGTGLTISEWNATSHAWNTSGCAMWSGISRNVHDQKVLPTSLSISPASGAAAGDATIWLKMLRRVGKAAWTMCCTGWRSSSSLNSYLRARRRSAYSAP
mmetsp:Transcript_13626/g.47067  ORF Transcript_13626/g.47067 Transcript_13626/m.47067 type:complete len:301 (+) Transcript_13626:1454-2356(+)